MFLFSVNIHQYQSLVASSEIASKTHNRSLIHIWDHVKLRTITEIRKEQFGSYINLLSFSPKPDDHLLLIISRDKPQIVLFLDWKRNELIYSITVRSSLFNSSIKFLCFSSVNQIIYFQYYLYSIRQNGLLV